jgi:hypothetical protein
MAMQSPASSHWQLNRLPERQARPHEGRAERFASWLIVYLTVFLTSLTLGGGAWALGLVR